MADGGYILDEDFSPEFVEYEKYSYFCKLKGNNTESSKALLLTSKVFKTSPDVIQEIIKKYESKS